MQLPVMPPISPMLAKLSREMPQAEGLLYEPKWDGFRAIVFRDGPEIELGSRNERPLTRYFPELVEALLANLPERCVLDGEIVIAGKAGLDFDALLQRIHPALSRIKLLATTTPSSFVAFDMLALGDEDLRPEPFSSRRSGLEQALARAEPPVYVTPATSDPVVARDWFSRFEGAGLDGVVAKAAELTYREGERVMLKLKHDRTADCAVAGFRWHKDGGGVGSLLLGLYDDHGALHHVGVASGFAASLRKSLVDDLGPYRLEDLAGHPWAAMMPEADGTRRPGVASRWNAGKDLSWEPLAPRLVCEVGYDHLQGDRFRHATSFRRWRPDREPVSCTYAQLESAVPEELARVFGAAG
ncbi:MAG: ATP-dependent DNA ligase [Acidimicrobiales bacterium]